jgi:hypothetical protein
MLGLLAGCATAPDEPGSRHPTIEDTEGAEDGAWTEVYVAVDLIIRANVHVSDVQATRLAEQIRNAYRFVTSELGDGSPVISPRLNVFVNSRAGANSGWATGDGSERDRIHISDSVLRTPRIDNNLIAHELTHVWEMRNGAYTLPAYADEGRACVIGDTYNAVNGDPNVWFNPTRRYLATIDAEIARVALQPNVRPTDENEYVAELWVEFLRARYPHLDGEGFADALPRLARVSVATAAGTRWLEAFETEFGISVVEARRAFFTYVDATIGNPTERFRGTLWQQ